MKKDLLLIAAVLLVAIAVSQAFVWLNGALQARATMGAVEQQRAA